MTIETHIENDVCFVRPEAPVLNISNKTKLQQALSSIDENKIAVDLSRIDYIDSTILGLFLHISKKLKQTGGNLVLFAANETIQGLTEMTRLNYLVEIKKNKKEVLENFAN